MSFNRVVCGIVFAAFFATVAKPATVEERLVQVENALAALAKENAALRAQLAAGPKSPAVPVGVVAQGKEAKLAIGGFVQANAEFGGVPDARFPANDRFYLRRARLGVKGSFTETFDFCLQSDFGNNSITGISGYRASLTDCFVNWNRFAAANVTIGQFKTPFGFEQLIADPRNPTIERSLPNDQLTLNRQIGAMVSGALIPNRLSYSVGLFNGNGANNGGNDNDQFLYVGRLSGTALAWSGGSLAAGVNAYTTRDSGTFTGRRSGAGVDVQAAHGPASLQAEYLMSHLNRDTGLDATARGWSLLAGWMFLPQTLQGLIRYETFDPSRGVGEDETNEWTLGFNYFIRGDDIKLSVNYLLGDPPGKHQDAKRLLTRMQVVF